MSCPVVSNHTFLISLWKTNRFEYFLNMFFRKLVKQDHFVWPGHCDPKQPQLNTYTLVFCKFYFVINIPGNF